MTDESLDVLGIECEGCGNVERLIVLVVQEEDNGPQLKFYCEWCLPVKLIGECPVVTQKN